jgi:vacuolar-type H+-ATPase subunit H
VLRGYQVGRDAVKEIVQKILETEKEVRESIEKAHADSQSLVREAEDKSRQVEEGVREKAMHEATAIMDRKKAEAEVERQRQIAAAQGGSADLIKKKNAVIREAADSVTNLILGIERKQGKLL